MKQLTLAGERVREWGETVDHPTLMVLTTLVMLLTTLVLLFIRIVKELIKGPKGEAGEKEMEVEVEAEVEVGVEVEMGGGLTSPVVHTTLVLLTLDLFIHRMRWYFIVEVVVEEGRELLQQARGRGVDTMMAVIPVTPNYLVLLMMINLALFRTM